MKNDLTISGKELEKFFKKNPTANFWISTGWGDRPFRKDGNGWYIWDGGYFKPDYYTDSQVKAIPELKVYIPKEK